MARDTAAPALRRAFESAHARRREAGLGEPGDTTAFRLAHGEVDGTPGWVVDAYGDWLVAQSYAQDAEGEGEAPQEARVLDALAALPFRGVYLKRRARQANVVADAERQRRAPELAQRGESAPEALVVHEHGVPLEVRLGEGFSTGLFLDQRAHRRRLREHAAGRVLNLFSYTCAFGVMAALAGAETVNVDLARRALEWGKRNYALSGLGLEAHRFYARDARVYLERAARRGERFDAVVLDPPSYARGARGRFRADRDYVQLAAAALTVTAPGGLLLACTNQQRLAPRAQVARLQRAADEASVVLGPVRIEPLGPDFPLSPGGVPHLKAAWLTPRSVAG